MESLKQWAWAVFCSLMVRLLRALWALLKDLIETWWRMTIQTLFVLGLELCIIVGLFSAWASGHAGRDLSPEEVWAVFDQILQGLVAKGGCVL